MGGTSRDVTSSAGPSSEGIANARKARKKGRRLFPQRPPGGDDSPAAPLQLKRRTDFDSEQSENVRARVDRIQLSDAQNTETNRDADMPEADELRAESCIYRNGIVQDLLRLYTHTQ